MTQFILAKFGDSKEITRIKYHHCIRSPITRTLFILKHEAGVHLKSTIDSFLLNPSPLETAWLKEALNLQGLKPNTSLKLLQKLLLYNIIKLEQIIIPHGTTLMNSDDFKTYYSKLTKLVKSALNIANQLFCHPSCHQECHLPCPHHYPPQTLKNDYTIINHTILPQHPTRPIHPPNPPIPHLPPPNNMLNNPRQFPIHTILDHKQRQLIDPDGIK